ETIDTLNTGESRGRETSRSTNFQKLGKDVPYLLMKSSAALNLT
ncbi:MAG: type IV secretion system protein VirD4, partial [Muricomes sp.]|nr:type IV secretion system protein VirD4 [Muricomes sp.]